MKRHDVSKPHLYWREEHIVFFSQFQQKKLAETLGYEFLVRWYTTIDARKFSWDILLPFDWLTSFDLIPKLLRMWDIVSKDISCICCFVITNFSGYVILSRLYVHQSTSQKVLRAFLIQSSSHNSDQMGLTKFVQVTGNPACVKKLFIDTIHSYMTPLSVCCCLEVNPRILGKYSVRNQVTPGCHYSIYSWKK